MLRQLAAFGGSVVAGAFIGFFANPADAPAWAGPLVGGLIGVPVGVLLTIAALLRPPMPVISGSLFLPVIVGWWLSQRAPWPLTVVASLSMFGLALLAAMFFPPHEDDRPRRASWPTCPACGSPLGASKPERCPVCATPVNTRSTRAAAITETKEAVTKE